VYGEQTATTDNASDNGVVYASAGVSNKLSCMATGGRTARFAVVYMRRPTTIDELRSNSALFCIPYHAQLSHLTYTDQ